MFGMIVIILGSLSTWLNPAGAPVPPSPDSIAAGAALFQANCIVCHGVEGLGNGPAAAGLEPPPGNLRVHVPLHENQELYGFISRGFPNTAMPSFADQFSSDEIWHLVNYLRDTFE